jgi:hypothetical protein
MVRYSSSVFPPEHRFESLPGASYWMPRIFSAELYSAAWAGTADRAVRTPAATAVVATRRIRMDVRPPCMAFR